MDEDLDDYDIFCDVASSISEGIECIRITTCAEGILAIDTLDSVDFLFVDGFVFFHKDKTCLDLLVDTALNKGIQVVIYTSIVTTRSFIGMYDERIQFLIKAGSIKVLSKALRKILKE